MGLWGRGGGAVCGFGAYLYSVGGMGVKGSGVGFMGLRGLGDEWGSIEGGGKGGGGVGFSPKVSPVCFSNKNKQFLCVTLDCVRCVFASHGKYIL